MNRDKQEMALWREAYCASRLRSRADRETVEILAGYGADADMAVEAFRKRYPPQPAAPKAVWYDTPPFEKDTANYPCWIEGYKLPGIVLWDGEEWRMYVAGDGYADPLAGRRVCPITKPQEPTT